MKHPIQRTIHSNVLFKKWNESKAFCHKQKQLIPYFVSIGFCLFGSCSLSAQNSFAEFNEPFNINNPFQVELRASFSEFVEYFDSNEYVTATISYYGSDSIRHTKAIKVKPRGMFRKKNCELPPLRIFFTEKDYEIELFNSLKKVKLVNSCGLSCSGNQYLVKEYLLYKAYEEISDYSFKTYSLQVKFINTDNPTEHYTHHAFIVEDLKHLAKRNEAKIVHTLDLDNGNLDAENESLMSMFQFMIGSTDWYVANQHNLKLLLATTSDKPIAVPYDFDFSGVVNAEYAFPNKSLPIKHVRERFYLGECVSSERYIELFAIFKEKKSSLYSLFEQCRYLDPLYKRDALEYLDSFYELIEDEEKASLLFGEKCWNTKN